MQRCDRITRRTRGTFSCWRLADRRCWRPATSENGMQWSARYVRAWLRRHRWTVTASLYCTRYALDRNHHATWIDIYMQSISLLPSLAEVYESLIGQWFLSALQPSFDHNQFGCRQNRSATPAMVAMNHAWQSAVDRGGAVRVVRRAFAFAGPSEPVCCITIATRKHKHRADTADNAYRQDIVALVYNYSNSLLVNFTGDTKNVIKDFKTHIFVRKFDTWLPLTIDIDLYCHF